MSDPDDMSTRVRNASPGAAMYRLPAEILLEIFQRLDVVDLPAAVCATYPVLRVHKIAPHMPTRELLAMIRAANQHEPAAAMEPVTPILPVIHIGIGSLPLEIRVQVTADLSINERINFVIATWGLYAMRPLRSCSSSSTGSIQGLIGAG